MINITTVLLAVSALATPRISAVHNQTTFPRQHHHLRSSTSHRNLQSCAELPTNLYFHLLNRQTHLSLHVEGMSQQNGANVVYEHLDDGLHDTFRLIRSGLGNFYHIVATHSNKVIAVSGSALEAGANIEQETLADTPNQDWCFIPTSNGYYQVQNRNSGQIIMADFEANVPNAGKNVFQWYYWGGAQQEWTLEFGAPASPVDSRPAECMGFPPNTFVHLIAKHSGMSITSLGSGNLVQSTVVAGARDNWRMTPGSDGHVIVLNQLSGLAMSYDPPTEPNGAPNLVERAPDDTSEWCFASAGGEFYYIRNKVSGNSVDVAFFSFDIGGNIGTWPYYGGDNQMFRIELAHNGGALAPTAPTPSPTPPPNTDHLRPWLGPYGTPVVGVSLANLPNGKILLWSAYLREFFDYDTGSTWTALYDPARGDLSEKQVSNTKHDFFCPGTATMENGNLMITGGANADTTTIYQWKTNSFVSGPAMKTPRGYHSMTVLGDGRVFTVGGSWHGGIGGKDGEIWSAATNQWTKLSGVPVTPLLTGDAAGVYRSDNHMWLFQSPTENMVFHAGPSKTMNWIDASGNGSITPSATRGSVDQMNGNAMVLDIGVLFIVGGAPNYDTGSGTNQAFLVDINDPKNVKSRKVGSLKTKRTLASSVILPGGQVVVVGGQTTTLLFADDNAVLTAEIFDPRTEKFTQLPDKMRIPRTYHSAAILMNDGRVMVAGGGLCGGCAATHNDFEILIPPYLFAANGNLAKQPVIRSSAASGKPGATIAVTMANNAIYSFELIRHGSVTHNVNNDQRRIPLTVASKSGSVSQVKIPNNRNVALVGTYYLFAIGPNGVPSVAKTFQIQLGPAVSTAALAANTKTVEP